MSEIRRIQPNLTPNARYVARVRAVNAFNVPSDWSESLVFTTLEDLTTPNPPTNILSSFDSSLLLILWTAPTTNTDDSLLLDLRGYELQLTANEVTVTYNTTDTLFFYMNQQMIDDFGEVPEEINVSIRAVDMSGNFSLPALTLVTLEAIASSEGEIAIFSKSGSLETSSADDCPLWELEKDGNISELIAILTVAGTTDSIFTVYVNGASIGNVSMTTGLTRATTALDPVVEVIAGDLINVACITAGTGAKSGAIKIRI